MELCSRGRESVVFEKEWRKSVRKKNEEDVLELPGYGRINQGGLDAKFTIPLFAAPSCVGGTKVPGAHVLHGEKGVKLVAIFRRKVLQFSQFVSDRIGVDVIAHRDITAIPSHYLQGILFKVNDLKDVIFTGVETARGRGLDSGVMQEPVPESSCSRGCAGSNVYLSDT